MRETKFRGLTGTTEGKKWVYGYYYKVKSFFNDEEAHFIGVIRNNHLLDFNIDEDTLGQYTGLHDKNGKEIYEGDIVEGRVGNEEGFDVKGIVVYCEYGYYFIKDKDDEAMIHIVDDIEVIGNVWEDSDLLKD